MENLIVEDTKELELYKLYLQNETLMQARIRRESALPLHKRGIGPCGTGSKPSRNGWLSALSNLERQSPCCNDQRRG